MSCLSPASLIASWRLGVWCLGVWCLCFLAAASARAQSDEAARQRFEALQTATVGVEVRVIDGAASGQTLGRLREGSGVFIAPQGLVLTIGYLLLEADSVQLATRDNKKIPAQVVAYDFVTGLGLLKPLFPIAGIQPVKLGSVASLDKGSPLLVITGSAPRQAGAVRLVDSRPFTGYWEYHLETALYTAPAVLNHSGAGLFNGEGDLVGVGHLLMRDVLPDGNPSVLPGNLFVPVDVLRPVIDELLRSGAHPQARRPWMGVNAVEVDGRIRITRVSPGSPAQASGLRPGHWVTAVEGEPVSTLEAFYKKVWSHDAARGVIRLSVREGFDTLQLEMPVRDRLGAIAKPRGI